MHSMYSEGSFSTPFGTADVVRIRSHHLSHPRPMTVSASLSPRSVGDQMFHNAKPRPR